MAWAMAVVGLLCAGIVPARAQDAAAGKQVFQQKCTLCHTAQPGVNRIGPGLYGVVGRKAGTEAGYTYSAAMKSFGQTWTEDELFKYLANPHQVVEGTKMMFPGISDDATRKNVIAYLATLHG